MTQKKDKKLITIIRRSMLIVAISVFAVFSIGIGYLIRQNAEKRAVDVMRLNILDVEADISDASDENLLSITQEVAESLNCAEELLNSSLFVKLAKRELQSSGMSQEKGNELLNSYPMQFLVSYLASVYDLSEISIVDSNGIIEYATAGHNPPLIRHEGSFDYL